jgi:hypothetical protein
MLGAASATLAEWPPHSSIRSLRSHIIQHVVSLNEPTRLVHRNMMNYRRHVRVSNPAQGAGAIARRGAEADRLRAMAWLLGWHPPNPEAGGELPGPDHTGSPYLCGTEPARGPGRILSVNDVRATLQSNQRISSVLPPSNSRISLCNCCLSALEAVAQAVTEGFRFTDSRRR